MQATVTDFIGVYDDVLTSEFCAECIEMFDAASEMGLTSSRQNHEPNIHRHQKDTEIAFSQNLSMFHTPMCGTLTSALWDIIYADYSDHYSAIRDLAQHSCYTYKMQRTQIGGGYHVWHSENGDRVTANRILQFIFYLNTVEEGGETEFLYYARRIKPVTGRAIIFPSGFTHTHRGNPPLSNTKYIVNGWIEF